MIDRRIEIVTVLVGTLLLFPGASHGAEGWSASFGREATGSYLQSGNPAVLVAPAGAEAETPAAASALIAALRASTRARLVMDAASLGSTTTLDDAAVVKRAQLLRGTVQLVIIVRVFPGAAQPTAVVTIYNLDRKTMGAFSVAKGTALAARGSGSGSGVSEVAASAVSRVLTDSSGESSKDEEYRRRHIGFSKYAVFHVYSGVLSGHWGAPYLGNEANMLDVQGFFRTVGRDDYARYYHRRRVIKRALQIPGWILLFGGGAMATVGGVGYPKGMCRAQNSSGECIDNAPGGAPALLWTGVAFSALGLGAIIAAATIKPFPTTAEQVYQLAADHNRKLRERLGLPEKTDDDVPPQYQRPARPARRELQVAPVARTNGVGLAVWGTF